MNFFNNDSLHCKSNENSRRTERERMVTLRDRLDDKFVKIKKNIC